MIFDWNFVVEAFPKVLAGAPMTLFLSVVSCFFALILGLLLALLIMYNVPVGKQVAKIYISYIRGTPLIVTIYIIYTAVPMIVSSLFGQETANAIPAVLFAIIAYSVNQSAFMAEMFRSALGSVDKGQMEAAYSVGMTGFQAFRHVVLPQAAVVGLPNFSNLFLLLIKGTSLAFTVTVVEIMAQAKNEASNGLRFLEAYLIAATIYWIICIAFEWLFKRLEKKLKK